MRLHPVWLLRWALFSIILGVGLSVAAPYLLHEIHTVIALGVATVAMIGIGFGTRLHTLFIK